MSQPRIHVVVSYRIELAPLPATPLKSTAIRNPGRNMNRLCGGILCYTLQRSSNRKIIIPFFLATGSLLPARARNGVLLRYRKSLRPENPYKYSHVTAFDVYSFTFPPSQLEGLDNLYCRYALSFGNDWDIVHVSHATTAGFRPDSIELSY